MSGKGINVKRLEPSEWLIGMNNPKLMLLVYGDSISKSEPIVNIPGVKVDEVRKVENINYLFIFLTINKSAKPGTYEIIFAKDGKVLSKK